MKILTLIIILISSLLAEYNATKNAENLGMYYQDYNHAMALTGVLIGTVLFFGMVLITIKVGSSR
jgi:hypothetical protein